MPLFDFRCAYCDAAFEARAASDASAERCPDCLSEAPRKESWTAGDRALPIVVAARKLGVETGKRARDGDDLERYARQHGSDAAVNLVGDLWGSGYAPYNDLRALADGEDAWKLVDEAVSDAFTDGFIAACGDVYDDDAMEGADED